MPYRSDKIEVYIYFAVFSVYSAGAQAATMRKLVYGGPMWERFRYTKFDNFVQAALFVTLRLVVGVESYLELPFDRLDWWQFS